MLTTMKAARLAADLSQAALADKVGVAQAQISAWETGRKPIPKARREQLAALLHVSAAALDKPAKLR